MIDARAFGPSQRPKPDTGLFDAETTGGIRTGIGAAGLANKAAGWGGYGVPGAGTALGLAGLFTSSKDRLGADSARFAMQSMPDAAMATASLFPAASHGLTATGMTASEAALAGGTAATGASVGASALGGLGLAALNAPQIVGGLVDTFDPPTEMLMRRARRGIDAANLQNGVLAPIANAGPGGLRNALATPVGGSTSGDALAAILRNNAAGTWYGDTSHNWLPDPTLGGLRQLLARAGYTGASEPRRGDVGGVGEIVAGGGMNLLTPEEQTAITTPGYTSEGTPITPWIDPAELGARGWEKFLRRFAGVPADTPSMFDRPNLPEVSGAAYRDAFSNAQAGLGSEITFDGPYAYDADKDAYVSSAASATDLPNYYEALDPEAAERVRAMKAARDLAAEAQRNAPAI